MLESFLLSPTSRFSCQQLLVKESSIQFRIKVKVSLQFVIRLWSVLISDLRESSTHNGYLNRHDHDEEIVVKGKSNLALFSRWCGTKEFWKWWSARKTSLGSSSRTLPSGAFEGWAAPTYRWHYHISEQSEWALVVKILRNSVFLCHLDR